MGLKETLTELGTDPIANNSLCKVGVFFAKLDEETKGAFVTVMNSSATTMDITRALVEEGFNVRRELIGEKRKCFIDPESNCCLGDSRLEISK
jgi:hypothetical protein